jgi:AcrR family transcriptional regulator
MTDTLEQRPNGIRTSREDWIQLARQTLVSEGVEKVKVLNLAQRLGVSRSSFYWFFESRQDLLNQLLDHWARTNTSSIVDRTMRPAATIAEAVLNVFECWVDETIFDPRLDFAIREWARRSETVRRALDQADEVRVAAIAAMFSRHGYEGLDAFIRARILYFMQIGYYALELKEPTEQRLSYLEAYVRGFTAQEATSEEIERFRAFARQRQGGAGRD